MLLGILGDLETRHVIVNKKMYTFFILLTLQIITGVIAGKAPRDLKKAGEHYDEHKIVFVKKAMTNPLKLTHLPRPKNIQLADFKQTTSRGSKRLFASMANVDTLKSVHFPWFRTTHSSNSKATSENIAADFKIKPKNYHLSDFRAQSSNNSGKKSSVKRAPSLYVDYIIGNHRVFEGNSHKTKTEPQAKDVKSHNLMRRNAIYDKHSRGEKINKTAFGFSVFGLILCFLLMVVLIFLYWSKKYCDQKCLCMKV
uniref:Uncharacterized protein n=1 Tax=Clytia hemisphaerica TaxID=252671 RepID=A0A7M5UNG6_9CNID|eukprot:TCONS_00031105-protein